MAGAAMRWEAVPVWFRFEDALYSAGVDEFDNPLGPPVLQTHLREFTVDKRTRCGVWLKSTFFRRFCLISARKQFACPTLEAALESFMARKGKQAWIYERRANNARLAMIQAGEIVEQIERLQLKSKRLNSWVIGGRYGY